MSPFPTLPDLDTLPPSGVVLQTLRTPGLISLIYPLVLFCQGCADSHESTTYLGAASSFISPCFPPSHGPSEASVPYSIPSTDKEDSPPNLNKHEQTESQRKEVYWAPLMV